MKALKLLALALAAGAACSGGAIAQSSVQVYGQLAAAVTQFNNQGPGRDKRTDVTNNNFYVSHLGFRGTEDLGGGWNAQFRLETGINPDSGTQSAPVAGVSKFWNRQAFVGLGMGQLGTITLGRQLHASTDRVIRTLDVFNVGGANLHVTPLAAFGVNRFFGNDTRVDDSIKYRVMGPAGLGFGASVGLDDGAGRSFSFDVAQTTKAYDIGAMYVKFNSPNLLANGQRPEHTTWILGGNVPLGPVKLYGMYLNSKLDATVVNRPTQRNDVWHFAAKWLVMPQLELTGAVYTDKGDELNGVAGRDGRKNTLIATAEYVLSKRTLLNIAIFENRFKDGYVAEGLNQQALGRTAASPSVRGISAGIRHAF